MNCDCLDTCAKMPWPLFFICADIYVLKEIQVFLSNFLHQFARPLRGRHSPDWWLPSRRKYRFDFIMFVVFVVVPGFDPSLGVCRARKPLYSGFSHLRIGPSSLSRRLSGASPHLLAHDRTVLLGFHCQFDKRKNRLSCLR